MGGGAITAVEVTDHNDTPFIADGAIETLTKAIVANQSSEVDVVSGATYTSRGVMNAVKDAVGM